MSARGDEFRRRAVEVTSRLSGSDDGYARALRLTIAQSYISLARSEEWLEGEIVRDKQPATAPEEAA